MTFRCVSKDWETKRHILNITADLCTMLLTNDAEFLFFNIIVRMTFKLKIVPLSSWSSIAVELRQPTYHLKLRNVPEYSTHQLLYSFLCEHELCLCFACAS